jgi:hypothetical protein
MPHGPWVQVAALCEGVEPGPPLKITNLVDRISVEGAPGQIVSLREMTLLICLWADDVPAGDYTLRIQPYSPSGTSLAPFVAPVQFSDSGPHGVNVIAQAPFMVDAPGVHWYDVLFVEGPNAEPRLLSRFPLTVNWREPASN